MQVLVASSTRSLLLQFWHVTGQENEIELETPSTLFGQVYPNEAVALSAEQ